MLLADVPWVKRCYRGDIRGIRERGKKKEKKSDMYMYMINGIIPVLQVIYCRHRRTRKDPILKRNRMEEEQNGTFMLDALFVSVKILKKMNAIDVT